MNSLDPTVSIVELTRALVDIESESLNEAEIADEVERVLRACAHLEVVRDGHTIIAKTNLGRAERVTIAGHLDTVPENSNLPARLDGDLLFGLGTCDMKGGVAIALALAVAIAEPTRDVTWVFYEAEEIAAIHNGLGRIARERPELLAADFAILMEPSNAKVEAGCQGTIRCEIRTRGERAHSARAWMGHNAIHDLAPALAALAAYQPANVDISGLVYREGLNAVGISGGIAGNVIPDEAVLTVNFRFAPNRTEDDAVAHVREVFAGFDVDVVDSAPGALPGLERAAVADFVAATGGEVAPKYGWTDVAKFTLLGIPAVNFGPGDPSFAHHADEHVPVAQLTHAHEALEGWLTA